MNECTERNQYRICEQHFKNIEDKLDMYTKHLKEQNEIRDTHRSVLTKEIYGGEGKKGILGRLDLHQYAIAVLAILVVGIKAVSLFW